MISILRHRPGRVALAKSISEAAAHVTKKGLSQRGAPAIVKLTEKTVAQAVIWLGHLVVRQLMHYLLTIFRTWGVDILLSEGWSVYMARRKFVKSIIQ